MIGVDIVAIARIERIFAKNRERFLQRYLNENEMAQIKKPTRAAGFWAAKEAVAKALGCGIGSELGFHDIEIYKDARGAPHFQLPKRIIERYGIRDTSLSISHDGGFAVAVAAIETSKPA